MSIYIPSKPLAEKIIEHYGSPVFVTDENTIVNRLQLLKKAFKKAKVFYALKANFSPAILKILLKAGVDGIDCVSPFEIKLAKSVGFTSNQIIFTGNNSDSEELKEVFKEGVTLNIGSIGELEHFGKMFKNSKISLRLNPGVGDGESDKVITGGTASKFGISSNELPIAKELISKYKLNVIGVHCHIGSGFYTTNNFKKAVQNIIKLASQFENLNFIDIGGGFGVRYSLEQNAIDLDLFYNAIADRLDSLPKNVELRIEPGKFLVAESTCLLTKVTNVKKSDNVTFIGTDTGMNHIIRPALYSTQHQIVNISNSEANPEKVTIVGNICETSDVLGKDLQIPSPEEGDILGILSAGAYCSSMSSLYNLRPYATEIVVSQNSVNLTRKRLTFNKIISSLGFV